MTSLEDKTNIDKALENVSQATKEIKQYIEKSIKDGLSKLKNGDKSEGNFIEECQKMCLFISNEQIKSMTFWLERQKSFAKSFEESINGVLQRCIESIDEYSKNLLKNTKTYQENDIVLGFKIKRLKVNGKMQYVARNTKNKKNYRVLLGMSLSCASVEYKIQEYKRKHNIVNKY